MRFTKIGHRVGAYALATAMLGTGFAIAGGQAAAHAGAPDSQTSFRVSGMQESKSLMLGHKLRYRAVEAAQLDVDSGSAATGEFSAVVTGRSSACALGAGATAGKVFCWGSGPGVGIGDANASVSASEMVLVDGGALAGQTVKSLVGTTRTTCATTTTNKIACWGESTARSADGTFGVADIPTEVPSVPAMGSETWASFSLELTAVGYNPFACGIDTAGAVWCGGSNGSGKLGRGLAASNTLRPFAKVSLPDVPFVSVIQSSDSACALAKAGQAYCWGLNASGQLGDGTKLTRTSPVAVAGGNTFTTIVMSHSAAGVSARACGQAGSDVKCWGGSPLTASNAVPRIVDTSALGGKSIKKLYASRSGAGNPSGTMGVLTTEGKAYASAPVTGAADANSSAGHPFTLVAGGAEPVRDVASYEGVGDSHVYFLTDPQPVASYLPPLPPLALPSADVEADSGRVTIRPDVSLVGVNGDTAETLVIRQQEASGDFREVCSFTYRQVQVAVNGDGAAIKCEVTGLINGLAETFEIVATGPGGESAPLTVKATPVGLPDDPQHVVAAPGDGLAVVKWTEGHNGGLPITKFTANVVRGGGDHSCVAGEGDISCTITGLTNNNAYLIRVTATNAVGDSAPSELVSVTPRADAEPEIALPSKKSTLSGWTAKSIKTKKGKKVSVAVTVGPKAKRTIVLEYSKGNKWLTAATVRTNAAGKATVAFKAAKGKRSYRCTVLESGDFREFISVQKKVTAK